MSYKLYIADVTHLISYHVSKLQVSDFTFDILIFKHHKQV